MNTKFWGPAAWDFFFCVALNYTPTPENIYYTKQLFMNLGHTMPCIYCRNSYRQFIRELNIDHYLASSKTLTYWLYLLHNKVNDKLRNQGNPVPPNPTFEYVCWKYNKHRAGCNPRTMSCSKPI